MRYLTAKEVTDLAARKGARRIAVENFVMTLDPGIGVVGNLRNLWSDARSYGWNAVTVAAITRGIHMAFRN